jgi:hypothetical protein
MLIDKGSLLPPRAQNEPQQSAIPLRVPLDQRLMHTTEPQNAPNQTPSIAPQGANKGTGHFFDTKGGEKGKRQPYEMASRSQPYEMASRSQPYEMASRSQPPQKSSRIGDSLPSPRLMKD